jgi:hypothetical protein
LSNGTSSLMRKQIAHFDWAANARGFLAPMHFAGAFQGRSQAKRGSA